MIFFNKSLFSRGFDLINNMRSSGSRSSFGSLFIICLRTSHWLAKRLKTGLLRCQS